LNKDHKDQDASRKKLPKRPTSICFASSFGATLKTVLDFSGISTEKKDQVAEALDDLAEFMTPANASASGIQGDDRAHLLNGLGTRTVSKKQSKLLYECGQGGQGAGNESEKKKRQRHRPNSFLYRTGQANVALGATAAVIVAHYVLAVNGSRPSEVVENLERSIVATKTLLQNWRMNFCGIESSKMHMAALGAEIRALERAKAAAESARKLAATQKLDRLSGLHLQLIHMRKAAWPDGGMCKEGETHTENLIRLRNGQSIRLAEMPVVVAPCESTLSLLGKQAANISTAECEDDGKSKKAPTFSYVTSDAGGGSDYESDSESYDSESYDFGEGEEGEEEW
jgi:hypothetical protein